MTLPCVRHTCSARLDVFLNEFLFHVNQPYISVAVVFGWCICCVCVCID